MYMLLCGSALRPADSWKEVASPLNGFSIQFVRRLHANALERKRCKQHKINARWETEMNAVHAVHNVLAPSAAQPRCRLYTRLDQGSAVDLLLYS